MNLELNSTSEYSIKMLRDLNVDYPGDYIYFVSYFLSKYIIRLI